MARKLYQVPEKKRTGEVILRTQGLGRSFVKNSLFGKSRSLEAVEPLSFEIHKGETFGLVGESGSGKTTLAKNADRDYPSVAAAVFPVKGRSR